MANDAAAIAAYDESLRKVPLHAHMGLEILQRGPSAVINMELRDDLRAAADGTVHGGTLATLADVACAVSLFGSFELGFEMPVTTDMHVRYYRQPLAGPISAKAQIVHRGRRLLSSECSIVDGQERVLARATATYMVVPRATPPN